MTSAAPAGSVRAVVAAAADPSRVPAHVVIAGGGFAALETLLALAALAGDRVRMTLISPDAAFAYRPAGTAEVFTDAPPRAYDLRAIADDRGAEYRKDRLEAVAPQAKYVRLASGARLAYDRLVLALGARARSAIPGALTFRDQRDVPRFRGVMKEVAAGAVGRLVFAEPSGCSWPLPLYELALLTAAHAARHHVGTEVTLVSPQRSPLAVFGAEASALVGVLLAERGVSFLGASVPRAVRRDGALELQFDAAIPADRVVAAPQLGANPIRGVPTSWWGFVPTDAGGRVDGLADVYAAGDVTTAEIKQGGLAAHQADRVAHEIAHSLGAQVDPLATPPMLRARLLGGERPLSLSVQLGDDGLPRAAAIESSSSDPDGAGSKVFATYLTPYLEGREPLGAES
jgi:sulfide:quinone oxidoreductase